MSPSHDTRNLATLASRLGGESYAGGARALIPAPGHSVHDRSVSLRVVDGRLLAHSFGAADWREVLDDLRDRGWIDAENRLIGAGRGSSRVEPVVPTRLERVLTAARLWDDGTEIRPRSPAACYIARRAAILCRDSQALRAHAGVAAAVYADRGPRWPALLAAVRDPAGALTAVEFTYLDREGSHAVGARTARKIVGVVPAGSAVRLTDPAEEMLVAEGVFTTASAMQRFGLPGWALLSTGNLRRWMPPIWVRRVLIAGDRGPDGERSAFALRTALRASGTRAEVVLPPVGCGDWNDLDQEEARRKGG